MENNRQGEPENNFDIEIGYRPSLILFWGGFDSDALQHLKRELVYRVPGYDDGLYTFREVGLLDTDEIIKDLKPYFSERAKFSFWQSLYDNNLILEDLVPNIAKVPKLQLIIIINTETVQSMWKKVPIIEIIDRVREEYSAQLQLNVVFVLIGNDEISINDDSPRFRIARHKGVENGEISSDLLSVLETFLVILLSSCLIEKKFVEHELEEIYIGASTVKINKELMGEYFNTSLFHFMVRSMKEKNLTPESTKQLIDVINEKTSLFDHQRTAKVLGSFPKDWHNIDNETIALINGGKLSDMLKTPGDDFLKSLSAYFIIFEEKIKNAVEVSTQSWVQNFKSYLVRLLSASPKHELASDDKIKLPVDMQSGLETALFYLDHLITKIKDLKDIPLGKDTQPRIILSTQPFYELLADEIKQKIDLNTKRLHRLKRRLTSIPGLVVYSIIFWSLLSFILASFLDSPLVTLSLIGLIITAVISITEWIGWKIQCQKVKNKIELEISNYLINNAILPIIRRELENSRRSILSNLQNLGNSLKRYGGGVNQLIECSEKEMAFVNRTVAVYNPEETQTFNIFDAQFITKNLEFAKKHIINNPEQRLVLGQILAEKIINNDELMLHSDQLHDLVMESVLKLRDMFFSDEDLIPYDLLKEYDKLKQGKIWKWLYLRALPVGEYSSFGDPLMTYDVILAKDNATFIGGFGFQSTIWPENCFIDKSNTSYEIICIRMVKVNRDLTKW